VYAAPANPFRVRFRGRRGVRRSGRSDLL